MVYIWEETGTEGQRDKTANTSLLKQLRHSVLDLGKILSDVIAFLFGFCYFTKRKVQPATQVPQICQTLHCMVVEVLRGD